MSEWEFTHDAGVHRLCRVADTADEIRRLRAENAALTAAVERVRALHRNRMHGAHDCAECHDGYPCPTLRALEETS